jgi:hypothetical protein
MKISKMLEKIKTKKKTVYIYIYIYIYSLILLLTKEWKMYLFFHTNAPWFLLSILALLCIKPLAKSYVKFKCLGGLKLIGAHDHLGFS